MAESAQATTSPPDVERSEAAPPDQSPRQRFFGSTPFLILVALVVAIAVKTFLV
jgi:hypothetical protein